nr:hypothetical protein [Nevskia sp.]
MSRGLLLIDGGLCGSDWRQIAEQIGAQVGAGDGTGGGALDLSCDLSTDLPALQPFVNVPLSTFAADGTREAGLRASACGNGLLDEFAGVSGCVHNYYATTTVVKWQLL